MHLPPRSIAIAALAVSPLVVLSGCGTAGGSGASAPLAPIQPSSYVTLAPATTITTIATTTTVANGTSADAQKYTVQSGDSVSKIAAKYGIDMEVLANYNSWPEGVQHPIFPGDIIDIPPGASVAGGGQTGGGDTGDDTGGGAGQTTTTAASGQGCTYTIVKDDNPSKVANKFDITVDELRAANPGGVMDTFLVGATLIIPPNGTC